TITVTLTPRDSHNNVVPLWTFRKDLTIVPSVNATVPGAVTVTAPAQDAAGAVTATLKYVDTSGQLLSKAARTGSTTVSIVSGVKKTVDTRFYPQVHVCLSNLDSNGYVTPGTTEVHICDGSGHAVPNGSGYTVTAQGISTSGCPTDGGGVCPSDTAGVKADFENLTGDDIMTLARTRVSFLVRDSYSGKDMSSAFPDGEIAFYGELKTHKSASNLGTSHDLFHVEDAQAFCKSVVRRIPDSNGANDLGVTMAVAVSAGHATGGTVSAGTEMATIHMGNIKQAIRTGGDTNPEIFTAGAGAGDAAWKNVRGPLHQELMRKYASGGDYNDIFPGTELPTALVFVNGSRGAATDWSIAADGVSVDTVVEPGGQTWATAVSIGSRLHNATQWNLSDAYFVNNWPGTPYTTHKGNGDANYPYVTQVNYITGYICAASLH
ncbi:hypothetical protein, partial [Salmonella enterica]|uniref:hypothetical protein n=1 Tax=Salmonella enterica TaxID=28901 RepID=UPI003732065A